MQKQWAVELSLMKTQCHQTIFTFKMFTQAKTVITAKRRKNPNRNIKNLAIKTLEKKLAKPLKQCSIFVVDNLEKLLSSQHEHEENQRTPRWLEKMNDHDFYNRTRIFFLELREKHQVIQRATPIIDSSTISKNINETLKKLGRVL